MHTPTEEAAYRTAYERAARGDAQAGIDQLTQTLKSHQDSGRLWELCGQLQLKVGRAAVAADCLVHAMCLVPLKPDARLALANAYERIGKKNLARDLYIDLAKAKDLPDEMLDSLARALGKNGLPEYALAVCREASKRQPESAAPLLGMVFYQKQLGFSPERLLPALVRALHLQPDDFDIRITLARTLHCCGRAREAADLLRDAPIEDSRCTRCLLAMQDIFEEVGDDINVSRCIDTLVAIGSEQS